MSLLMDSDRVVLAEIRRIAEQVAGAAADEVDRAHARGLGEVKSCLRDGWTEVQGLAHV